MVVDKLQGRGARSRFDPDAPVKHVAGLIPRKRPADIMLQKSNVQSLMAFIPQMGQWIVGRLFRFRRHVVVLLFVLYFMLIGPAQLGTYCRELLPFNHRRTAHNVILKSMIVRSNAIVIRCWPSQGAS